MQGLWIVMVSKDHPLAYDPEFGKAWEGQRWLTGAIIAAVEGEAKNVPPLGDEDKALGARYYRWQFYAGKTLDDLMMMLPMGVEKKPENIKGGLRLKFDSDPIIREGNDLLVDIKSNTDKRR